MLDFGLSESEKKAYKGCGGSELYTKLGSKSDTKGINVMHCGLALLEVLKIKVWFAVHLIFHCRRK